MTISGDIGGTPFTCAAGNTCFQPIPQGNGMINYTATAAQSGMSANGSTAWKLDATPPSVNGTLSGAPGTNGWYLGSVTYNGSASDALSGLASLTCTLDGSPLGSCNPITVTGEGAHTLVITARDQAGNVQTLNQNISLDIQNPNLSANISGTLGSNNWYTSAALNASASDPAPGSGLSALEYSLDNNSWIAFPISGMLDLPAGVHDIKIRAVDNAGRIVSSSRSYSLDGTLPSITLSPSGALGSNNWYTTDLTLTASASDDTSGLDIFEYSLNNGAWTTYSTPLTLGNGTQTVSFWAQDKAGLVKQVDETYKVDTRAPQIAGSLSGVPGANGWYISQVTISASATDPVPGSGLEALIYILNGGAQTTYTAPLTLSNGQHTIQFDAQDFAGLTDVMAQTVKVDTVPPSLNIATTLPTWSKGSITLNGMAGDGGSGLSKVEISTDGGLTWQAVSGTTTWNYVLNTTTSGVYQMRIRSTDNAGLTTEQGLDVGVDNSAPKISLPASWLQWDTVTLDAWDNDSGLSEVRVEISDPEGCWKTRKIDLDPDNFPLAFKWDRRFGDDTVAPLGTYDVKVIATDNMGNQTQANATIKILLGILPVGPAATSQPYVRIDSTPVPVSAPASFATSTAPLTPVTSAFGSTPEPSPAPAPGSDQIQDDHAIQMESIPAIIATPRVAPTQTTVMDWLESVFLPSKTEESVTDVSSAGTDPSVHWGATLAAMAAAVTAYTLAEKRKREEEERPLSNFLQKILIQKTADMKAKEAEEQEIAEFNAEQKRREAEKEARKELIENNRAAGKEELLEAEIKSYSAKPQEWQTAYNAYMTKKAMDEYRAGEKEMYTVAPKEKSWWEKTLNWVDEHQVEISLGIGIVVGIAALVISGGAATPLVAAAWMAGAAAVAGGTVAIGTVGLNAYFGRPLMENVGRNLVIAGVTAAVITGAGFLFQGAMASVTTYCATNSEKCAKVEPILNGIDYAEQAFLQAKLAYQIWAGDTIGAMDTQVELDAERMDGGMPGNAVVNQVRNLGDDALQIVATYGDDTIPLLLKYGDDAIDIIGAYGDEGISLLQLYGDEAVKLIREHGTPAIKLLTAVNPESAQTLLRTLDDDVLEYAIDQGPDAVAALSRWSEEDLLEFGPELALRAKKDAKVLQDIKKLVSLGPIDPKHLTSEQQELINTIAENSIQYNDEGQIVLGKWVDYGNGFTSYARETGSAHYNPHPDMWNLLGGLGDNREEAAWLVNKQVIQKGIDKGVPFEYTLNGVPPDKIELEQYTIEKIWEGAPNTEMIYTNIMDSTDLDYVPIRAKELVELYNAGYTFSFDSITNSYILIKP